MTQGLFLDCFPRKICPQQVAVLKRQAEGLLKSMKTNLMNELWNSTVVAFWVHTSSFQIYSSMLDYYFGTKGAKSEIDQTSKLKILGRPSGLWLSGGVLA